MNCNIAATLLLDIFDCIYALCEWPWIDGVVFVGLEAAHKTAAGSDGFTINNF